MGIICVCMFFVGLHTVMKVGLCRCVCERERETNIEEQQKKNRYKRKQIVEKLTEGIVVYFAQLLGAACTRKLVETLFLPILTLLLFLGIFSDFSHKNKKKRPLSHSRAV